jgi:hypothetical protein
MSSAPAIPSKAQVVRAASIAPCNGGRGMRTLGPPLRWGSVQLAARDATDADHVGAVVPSAIRRNIAENLRKAQAEELKLIIDKVFSEADMMFRRMATCRVPALPHIKRTFTSAPRTSLVVQSSSGRPPLEAAD